MQKWRLENVLEQYQFDEVQPFQPLNLSEALIADLGHLYAEISLCQSAKNISNQIINELIQHEPTETGLDWRIANVLQQLNNRSINTLFSRKTSHFNGFNQTVPSDVWRC